MVNPVEKYFIFIICFYARLNNICETKISASSCLCVRPNGADGLPQAFLGGGGFEIAYFYKRLSTDESLVKIYKTNALCFLGVVGAEAEERVFITAKKCILYPSRGTICG
jgi:hypothetical protein